MKKYLFGLSAIVLAIAFSAFTKPVKTNDTFSVFQFTPPSGTDYSEEAVEIEANWDLLGSSGSFSLCSEDDQNKACRILVNDNFVDGSDLDTDEVTILAEENMDGKAFVTTSSTGVEDIGNQDYE